MDNEEKKPYQKIEQISAEIHRSGHMVNKKVFQRLFIHDKFSLFSSIQYRTDNS